MSQRDPELETLRAGLTALGERAVPGDDCPSPERIWAAVHGAAGAAERREVVDHVSTCLTCAEAWDLVEALRRDAGAVGAGRATTASPRGTRPLWLPLAAVLAVALGLGVWLSRLPTPPVDRGPAGSTFEAEVRGPLSRSDCTLEWRGPEGATSYDVAVSALAGGARTTIFERRHLTEPRLTIPREALADVPPGSSLFWHVSARSGARVLAEKTVPTRLE